MHHQMGLAYLKSDDVVETWIVGVHAHACCPFVLDYLRPSKASLPFGWPERSAAGGKISYGLYGQSPPGPPAARRRSCAAPRRAILAPIRPSARMRSQK